MADAQDSKSCGLLALAGSTPAPGTADYSRKIRKTSQAFPESLKVFAAPAVWSYNVSIEKSVARYEDKFFETAGGKLFTGCGLCDKGKTLEN